MIGSNRCELRLGKDERTEMVTAASILIISSVVVVVIVILLRQINNVEDRLVAMHGVQNNLV